MESLYYFGSICERMYPLNYGFQHLSFISQEYLLESATFWYRLTIKNSEIQFILRYTKERGIDLPYIESIVTQTNKFSLLQESLFSYALLLNRLESLLKTPASNFNSLEKSSDISIESFFNEIEKEIVYVRVLLSQNSEVLYSLKIEEKKAHLLPSDFPLHIQNLYFLNCEEEMLWLFKKKFIKENYELNFIAISTISSGFIWYISETPSEILRIKRESL